MAVVLDLFNREVVGWSIKPRMTADLVTEALTMAWFRRRPAHGALHHSDRGSRSRRHSSLGFVSPAQFMQGWLKAQQTKESVA
ncbi:hypothetical protein ACEQUB_02271 [Ralstonia syzygii]|uniref:Putative transposase n=1 Tax=Ralstonia syzygii R24 TaxID=907261 RepID=G2ZYP1_9RALS|nr:putative transposase [Ralstonia syzygii R24]